MSQLRTSTIEIRGQSYVVREMSGKVMKGARELIFDDKQKQRLEAWVSYKCCVTPEFESEDDASEAPHIVIAAISAEAFRLSKDDELKNA